MKSNLLNNTPQIITAGLAGTSAMTLYSYILSQKKNENFREPLLLAEMLYTIVPNLQKKGADKMGWILHFCVGVFFAFCYSAHLKRKSATQPVTKGLSIGTITGIVAVIIWKGTFRIHPAPPEIKYKRFYGQLIISHAIFGLITVAALAYRRKRLIKHLHQN